jgi:tetratricopeptide (TPR) repeat protein
MAGVNKVFEDRISQIEGLIAGNEELASQMAAELVRENPTEARAWLLSGRISGRLGKYERAINEISRAIEISDPEPANFFDRGRYFLRLMRFAEAESDFSIALELCDKYEDDYYRETLHFFRADARVRMGRKQGAREDLTRVSDGFALWTTELRTKEALLTECNSSE